MAINLTRCPLHGIQQDHGLRSGILIGVRNKAITLTCGRWCQERGRQCGGQPPYTLMVILVHVTLMLGMWISHHLYWYRELTIFEGIWKVVKFFYGKRFGYCGGLLDEAWAWIVVWTSMFGIMLGIDGASVVGAPSLASMLLNWFLSFLVFGLYLI